MPAPAVSWPSSESARSTTRMRCPRTSTSSPSRSSPGSCCRQARPPCRNITTASSTGLRKASPAARRYSPGGRHEKMAQRNRRAPRTQGLTMTEPISRSLVVHGASILLGFIAMGWLLGNYAVRVKKFDRTVVVKGLSEREVPADVAIWPLTFQEASNDLNALFGSVQKKNALITEFLAGHGIAADAVTVGAPAVTDRYAQAYGETGNIAFRYTASSTVTVYSIDVEAVRKAMRDVISLGQKGVALSGEGYQGQTQFQFTGLAELKPAMIEEATKNARSVAEKFAEDSESRLGKIRSAQQGQFSIEDRDSTTPHIKKVRVVSTVEYHLAD